MLIIALVGSGRLHFSFFPPIEADYLAARLTMPQGTPVEETERAVRRMEAAVADLRARLDPRFAPPGESLVENVLASVGAQPFKDRQSNRPQSAGRANAGGAHLAEVVLGLIPSEGRAGNQHQRNRTALA